MPKRTATARKPTRAAGSSKSKPAAKTAKAKTPAAKSKKVSKKVTKTTKKAPAKAASKPAAKSAKVASKPAPKAPAAAKTSAKAAAKTSAKSSGKTTKAPKAAPEAEKPSSLKQQKPAKVTAEAPEAAAPAATAPAAPEAAEKKPRKSMGGDRGRKAKGPGPQIPKFGEPLFRPGAPAPKPLIASGPNAPPSAAPAAPGKGVSVKSTMDKKNVEHFRQVLLQKRTELIGDISTMETEALMGESGALSHLPQHMAEQGSDVYGQSLSLDLAAADRRLIKEIDDALLRIQAGTYGVCELTGKPIKIERLHELPWARYSIEAAREVERRGTAL